MTILATRFANAHVNDGRSVQASTGLALTRDEIFRAAPSVFAETPHHARSARYAYIPTSVVVEGLAKEGFQPFYAIEAKSRTEDGKGYTKHMLRLRHADHLAKSGDVNEVILINSHNGSSAYQMLAGNYRFVCANGTVCGTTIQEIRVKHSGNVQQDVIQGAFDVVDGFRLVDAQKDEFRALQLPQGAQRAYASAALALRFGVDRPAPITVEAALQPMRYEDRQDDLWTTFQRVQENLMKGGQRIARDETRTRNGRVRAVNGIDGNVSINRGLWVLAEELKKQVA